MDGTDGRAENKEKGQPCPDCGGVLALADAQMQAPENLVDWYAVDRGAVYQCAQCGVRLVVWPPQAFVFKAAMAIFTLWFGLWLAGTGLFAASLLFGLPALFGFPWLDLSNGEKWAALGVAVIALGCAWLSFVAYLPDVAAQIRLRWRLRAARRA